MFKEYTIKKLNQDRLIQSVINLQKKSLISVLNYLVPSCYKMKNVWFGYKHMGQQLGFCERTIQRAVHELKDLGILQVEYRLMTSNLYKVNPEIYALKEQLKHKIPSLWGKFIVLSLSLLIGNVVPSENQISFSRGSIYTSVSIRGHGVKLTKKRREIFDMESGKPKISTTLREITEELKLTRHGQCKLLTFDDEVLSVVWQQGKDFIQDLKNPISWMIKQCVEQSTKQKIKVDWEIYYLLLKKYSIDKKSALAEEKTKEPKKECVVVDRTEFNVAYQQRLLKVQQEAQNRVKDKPVPSWLQECTQRFIQAV